MIAYFSKTLVVLDKNFWKSKYFVADFEFIYKAIFPILNRYGKKNQIVTKIKYTNIIFQFTKHRLWQKCCKKKPNLEVTKDWIGYHREIIINYLLISQKKTNGQIKKKWIELFWICWN